jgi:hypothetical protein
MPAIDQCEPQIIRALQKQGWKVIDRPFAIRIGQGKIGYVYADLRLNHIQNQQSLIVVEVKCFSSTRTVLDEFYQAIGQYMVYRHALKMKDIQTPLYLAIPETIYASFFQNQLIADVLQDTRVKQIVVDLEKEEVVLWRH